MGATRVAVTLRIPSSPRIEFMGETTAGRVVFGAEDSEPILGVTALESVGVIVDPVRKELRRLPSIPLRRAASAPEVCGATP